jgi:hypothetical protein
MLRIFTGEGVHSTKADIDEHGVIVAVIVDQEKRPGRAGRPPHDWPYKKKLFRSSPTAVAAASEAAAGSAR